MRAQSIALAGSVALEAYGDTALHKRIQKNIHSLSLDRKGIVRLYNPGQITEEKP